MAIELWDPFNEAVSLRDAMNSLFRESFIRPSALTGQSGPATPPLDVSETENDYVVKVSLPGVKPEDVKITVQGNMLSIRGEAKSEEERKGEHWHIRERKFGAFQRTLSLGSPVASDQAEARYENGVLTLTLPKAEESKPKQIKIGTAQEGLGHDKESRK